MRADPRRRTGIRTVDLIAFAGLAVLVSAAVLSIHWPVLSAQALSFDDDQYVTDNELVHAPGWPSARRFFTEVLEPSTVEGYYQPLAMVSLMLDYAAGGRAEALRPFHRTSLALHIANTILVMILLHTLFGQAWVAAIVALCFGAHPISVESIAWVGERKTVLAAFFCLWTLILYVGYARRPAWWRFALALIVYVLALLSKPTSTPLPLLLLLLDWWPLQRAHRRALVEKLPFVALAAIFAVITIESQSRTAGAVLPGEYPSYQIPLIVCHNIIFYLLAIAWPAHLGAYYPFPDPLTLSQPMVAAGLIGTTVLLAGLLLSLRWTRALVAGWLFFFLAVLPTMGLIGFTEVIAADRFAYLPLVGVLLPLAYGLRRWAAVNSAPSPPWGRWMILITAALIVAAAEAGATRRTLTHWRDTDALSQHMLAMAPHAPGPLRLRGVWLFEQGRTDEAIAHYRDALRLGPNDADTHHNLATALALQGERGEAIAHFREAVRLNPHLAVAHHNLAVALAGQGKIDESIAHFKEALRLRPGLAEARKNLAILEADGETSEPGTQR